MSGAVPPLLPLYACMVWTVTTLPFYFLKEFRQLPKPHVSVFVAKAVALRHVREFSTLYSVKRSVYIKSF
jgi:hypothetical protein